MQKKFDGTDKSQEGLARGGGHEEVGLEVIGSANTAGKLALISDPRSIMLPTYGVYILFFSLFSLVLEKWRGIGKTRGLFFAIETRRSLEAGRVIMVLEESCQTSNMSMTA